MKKTCILALFAFTGSALFSQSGSQAFTSSGTFIVPAGITSLTIEVVGAGGTGGGNGGGYAKGVYNVTPGGSIPITIGTGGSGPSGGTTSAGTFLSASGGDNGNSVANPNIGGGGAGGAGSNGTIANYTGGTGGGGYWTYFGGGGGGAAGSASNGSNGGNTIAWSGMCQTPGGSAGAGGGAPGGAGGKGAGFTDVNCNVTDPSGNGVNYGGGGGGGNGNSGPAGIGADGYCFIVYSACVAPASPSNNTPTVNLAICGSGSTTLSAMGSGTITWYTSPTAPGPVGTGSTFVTPVLNANTTYYAEDFTCTGSANRTAITITVNPLPTVTVAASTSSVCLGSSVSFTASGASAYLWTPYNPAEMSFSVGPVTTVTTPVSNSYTVTGTDANGCVNTASVTIAVFALPTTSATSSHLTLCRWQTATLTLGGASAYTVVNTGAVSGTTLAVSPMVTTTYTIIGLSANGCVKTVTFTQFVSICDGVAESQQKNNTFRIYPNPNRGDFFIMADMDMSIELMNELGQIIRTLHINNDNRHQCMVKNLAPGIYFMVDKSNAKVLPQKIIVSD